MTTRIAWHISPEDIQGECEKLLASGSFAHTHQLRKLLVFMVDHSLLDDHQRITQSMIASDVLGDDDFDSLFDSNVRQLAARLREHLRDYYTNEGRDDPVVITFPKGQPYRLIATKRHSIETAHPLDDNAFDEYRKGRVLWALRTPESLRAAMECFQRAIQMHPAYSLAFSALAECYFFMAIWGAPPTAVMPHAKANVLQALEIDNHNAEAHATLGAIHSGYDWEWESATDEFERALAIDDKLSSSYCWYSAHLVCLEEYEKAVHTVRLAQAADLPVSSAVVNTHAAKVLLVAGRNEEAKSLLLSLRGETPSFYLPHLYQGVLDGIVGSEHDQAISSLKKAGDLSNRNSSVLAVLGSVYARAGRTADAEKVLAELLEQQSGSYIPATDLAPLYFDLGRVDEAFACLDQAVEEKCIFLTWMASWPPLKELAADPRGTSILRRMGLRS